MVGLGDGIRLGDIQHDLVEHNAPNLVVFLLQVKALLQRNRCILRQFNRCFRKVLLLAQVALTHAKLNRRNFDRGSKLGEDFNFQLVELVDLDRVMIELCAGPQEITSVYGSNKLDWCAAFSTHNPVIMGFLNELDQPLVPDVCR